jgi:hypothetical protein
MGAANAARSQPVDHGFQVKGSPVHAVETRQPDRAPVLAVV